MARKNRNDFRPDKVNYDILGKLLLTRQQFQQLLRWVLLSALCLTGLILLSGWNVTSVKLALILVFLWLASPVASHLIARLELTLNDHPETEMELIEK